jgi:acyl carrier protein
MEKYVMTKSEILETLKTTMKDSSPEPIEWDTLTEETTIGSLGFDSLSILDLIYDVQQAFGIDFEAEELVNINTVGELADFLEETLKA